MRNSLKITVVSSPNFKNQEAVMITRLMEAGLEKFHLRNGAKLIQKNETTQNFEYEVIK